MFPNGRDVEQDGVLESIKLRKRVKVQRGTVSGNISSGVYQCYITINVQTTGTANVGLYDHTEGKCQSDWHDYCHCMSKFISLNYKDCYWNIELKEHYMNTNGHTGCVCSLLADIYLLRCC